MDGDLSSEVVHCPNCNEDVPKTLYCLNCGYPLYKMDQQKEAEARVEAETLEVTTEEPSVTIGVDLEEPNKIEEAFRQEPEIEETIIDIEEPEIEIDVEDDEVEAPVHQDELVAEDVPTEEINRLDETQIEQNIEPTESLNEKSIEETEVTVAEETEPLESEAELVEAEEVEELIDELEPDTNEEPEIVKVDESLEETEDETPLSSEVLTEFNSVITEQPQPVVEEAMIETMPHEYIETEEEAVAEPVETVYEPEKMETNIGLMDEIKIEFAPDPLTKEVMENLAKNITLKIRLVKLLRDNKVKEETFKKLFDSYVEQGKLWVSRRDEIIKRFNSDIERMEHSLVTARKDYELLEIRKSIGDADEEEYGVKAPAFRWDIEHLETSIKNRKAGLIYVANLKKLCPQEEVVELRRMADTEYNELDSIEGVASETIANMKETLADALASLES